MKSMRELVEFTRNKELSPRDNLLNSALGMVCEAGEYGDHIKKFAFQGHDVDRAKCLKELGDVLWYVELALISLNATREEVEQVAIAKLLSRYPAGFAVSSSVNRVTKE